MGISCHAMKHKCRMRLVNYCYLLLLEGSIVSFVDTEFNCGTIVAVHTLLASGVFPLPQHTAHSQIRDNHHVGL